MDGEKQISEEEKIIAEEAARLVEAEQALVAKPKRRRRKKSQAVEEFLKNQAIPAEQPKETRKYEPVNFGKESLLEVQDEEEIVDKLEAKPDAYAIEEKSARKKKFLKISLIAVASLLFLSLLGSAGYFYFQYKKAVKNISSEIVPDESLELAEKVGKHIILPQDEKPTIATVTDKDKISSQPFFARAENGDKALIYAEAKKAILYRPSIDRLIEVMPLAEAKNNDLSQSDQPAPADASQEGNEPIAEQPDKNQLAESQPQAARVAVYNGGRINGLAQKISDLVSLMPGVTVSEKTNAQSSYQKTFVIDLSGSRQELAQKMAEALEGEIGTMPEGETKPAADILIIGGSDFNKQSL